MTLLRPDDPGDAVSDNTTNFMSLPVNSPKSDHSAAGHSNANTDPFRTDHIVRNLGSRALSGGVVTVTSQAAKFGLNLISVVVLARLITPEEFGVVGMVLAVTTLLSQVKEAGLSTATIQRETITQDQVSNLFWINLTLSAVVALLSVGLAPFVAWFYRDPRLVNVMAVLSLTILLTGSSVQHQALLTRQMKFRSIAVIEIFSIVTGIVIGVCLALMGWSYWSLVGMQLGIAVATVLLSWSVSGWRPTMPKRRSGTAPLVRFGAHLAASDIIGRFAARADGLLIGRYFGAESLGLYNRANVLLARPLDQLLSPISSVVIPVLSRLNVDPERYRRTFLRVYDTVALVTFPSTALALVLSEPLVLLLLGSEWTGAIPLFAGFALVAVSLPLSIAASWLFLSQGRGRDLLRTYSIASATTVAAFVVGLKWGAFGVVMSLAVASIVIRLPILYHQAGRSGPVSTSDLWYRFFSHLPIWVLVCAATSVAKMTVSEAPSPVQLLVCSTAGLAAAGVAILALKRPREIAAYLAHAIRGVLADNWARATARACAPAP